MTNINSHDGRNLSKPIPERIREAREARGYTLESFAEVLHLSKQAVAQYENGQISPSGKIMREIISVTKQPPSFFVTQRVRAADGISPFWRSLKRMELCHRKRIMRRLEWAKDLVSFVSQYIQIPVTNLPQTDFNPDMADMDQIEAIAESVRSAWGLGKGPVRDLSALMELNGIVLVREKVSCEDMDAVSCWQEGRPYVLFSEEIESGPRNSYNLAHELGHIVLHAAVTLTDKNLKDIEKQANRFASAFLLPQETFSREVLGTSIDHFLFLKEHWGVSISAMIYRCKGLNLISQDQYQYLMRQMNIKRIRKVEPFDEKFQVRPPSILGESIKMLIENGVQTKEQIEGALNLNMEDIESLCGLHSGYLDNKIVPFTPQLANDN